MGSSRRVGSRHRLRRRTPSRNPQRAFSRVRVRAGRLWQHSPTVALPRSRPGHHPGGRLPRGCNPRTQTCLVGRGGWACLLSAGAHGALGGPEQVRVRYRLCRSLRAVEFRDLGFAAGTLVGPHLGGPFVRGPPPFGLGPPNAIQLTKRGTSTGRGRDTRAVVPSPPLPPRRDRGPFAPAYLGARRG